MAARPRRAERSAASVSHRAGALEPRAVRPARDQPGTGALPPVALDTVIHERLRLAIVSALAVNERLSFNELKRLIDTTDGNLSVHGRKLESAGYVACEKSFDGRVPKTEFRLTAAGRRALEKYLAHMEALIKAIKT